ncbi:MAG: hypothetical protein U9Q61_06050 [Thermodesulfobacteriota bacterium]|nr:hypothetical protein [Thermodesulfobacteriota bacterium]
MNIKEELRNNKLTIIAAYKFIMELAATINLSFEGTLSAICENAGVNRTQVYERKNQLEEILAGLEFTGSGRPSVPASDADDILGRDLREKVLRYRLEHPGAVVFHGSGRATYSNGFIRFILDLLDEWEGSPERFCQQAEIPYSTLRVWIKKDEVQPFSRQSNKPTPCIPVSASEDVRRIVEDYEAWQGSIREFFKYESARMHMGPTPIRRVLVICEMLPPRSIKSPRYRGSTTKCQPGSILVTDGKEVDVQCTGTGEMMAFNWQGIVDQATACHTAVVITATECAAGVRKAFDDSCTVLGQEPQALIHDNKPIHNDRELREHIEKTTKMIPAAPGTPENKAVIEGEFGKFEQAVGTIVLDDTNKPALIESAVHEICRAYTAGLNHAGRAECNGKSREQVLREYCPDPEKDRKFIEQLHADHTGSGRIDVLPTTAVSRALLDEGFVQFGLQNQDPEGQIRQWLADRYTPEAIQQALAIFGTEWNKGRLRNKMAHRYLVKVIQNCQEEVDLRIQEELLRKYAQKEHQGWLQEFEAEYQQLKKECDCSTPEKNILLCMGEKAVFGGLALQRSFWEDKLKHMLGKCHDKFSVVCRHIRRLFEAKWNDRFVLISKLVAWEHQLDSRVI